MSELGIPVDIEKLEISSTLNSTILQIYLMGMYTMIYFGTIYVYLSRNSSNRRLVPATITILFLANVVQTGIQWYLTKWQFINNGDTRDSVFLATINLPQWASPVGETSAYLGFVLGDGLLIWRCYFVWDRSVRIISVPLLLIITEAGLFLFEIIIHAIFTASIISPGLALRVNNVLTAAYFMSFATSLVTTILIAYRIYSVMKQEGTSTRRFKHVLDIVVQSGLLYSLSMLVAAISSAPLPETLLSAQIIALQEYTENIVIPVTGMASTILVARVALLAPDNNFSSTSIHLSELQFHARSTRPTDTQEATETTHSMNVYINSEEEGREVRGKVQ